MDDKTKSVTETGSLEDGKFRKREVSPALPNEENQRSCLGAKRIKRRSHKTSGNAVNNLATIMPKNGRDPARPLRSSGRNKIRTAFRIKRFAVTGSFSRFGIK
jgi:hypothetical protein